MARVRLDPEGIEIECEPGTTLLEAGLEHGLDMPFGCMSAKCGVCRVEVLEGAGSGLEPPSMLERLVLEGFHCPPGVRLACQARLAGDLVVRTAPGVREEDPADS